MQSAKATWLVKAVNDYGEKHTMDYPNTNRMHLPWKNTDSQIREKLNSYLVHGELHRNQQQWERFTYSLAFTSIALEKHGNRWTGLDQRSI